MNNFYVYGLFDTREPFVPFYIGYSGDRDRFSKHEYDANKKYVKRYVYNKWRKIERTGGTVELVKIEENLLEFDAKVKEVQLIEYLTGLGIKLTNLTKGGDGVVGLKHSEASKEKNRQKHLGKKHGPCKEDTKKKIGFKNKKRMLDKWKDPVYRQHMIDAHTGIKMPPFTEDHKRNIGLSNKATWANKKKDVQ